MSEAEYMARLIDADKLNFHCNYDGDCTGDISHCKECDNYVLDYRDIQEQPTAYDVDKVVEQLEEKDSDCEDFGTCNYCQRNWCPRTLIDRDVAIKIVKAGGIDG